MSVRQKVGQVLILSYPGSELSAKNEAFLKKYQPGALIVFGRNIRSPKQIANYNAKLQKLASKEFAAPLFLMIDQEGGTVARLKTRTPLPSALALGKVGDPEFIGNFAKAKAGFLSRLGFNVNLAPVLDLSNPTGDSFIGNRAFGADPEKVGELATAYAKGLVDGGILPTGKHFPGHGGIVQDSHVTVPKKLSSIEDLEAKDIIPFRDYAASSIPKALMMAHLALPNVDTSGVPATYSRLLIQEHLRDKLNYDGLVITDDLEMSGAKTEKDIGERAITAFLAGNDMLMFAGSPSNQKSAFEALVRAVQSQRISQSRLNESVSRILQMKEKLKVGSFTFNEKKAKAASKELQSLSRDVMRKNFQIALEIISEALPELGKKTRVLVLGSDPRFFKAFRDRFHGKTTYFRLTPRTLATAPAEISRQSVDTAVFYASGTKTATWLNSLDPELRQKTIVLNAAVPSDVEVPSSFLSVLNLNSPSPESGEWLADALISSSVRAPADLDRSFESLPEEEPPVLENTPVESPTPEAERNPNAVTPNTTAPNTTAPDIPAETVPASITPESN